MGTGPDVRPSGAERITSSNDRMGVGCCSRFSVLDSERGARPRARIGNLELTAGLAVGGVGVRTSFSTLSLGVEVEVVVASCRAARMEGGREALGTRRDKSPDGQLVRSPVGSA
jgi:hypothetical protein